jgi:hypothetical protein
MSSSLDGVHYWIAFEGLIDKVVGLSVHLAGRLLSAPGRLCNAAISTKQEARSLGARNGNP